MTTIYNITGWLSIIIACVIGLIFILYQMNDLEIIIIALLFAIYGQNCWIQDKTKLLKWK